MSDVVTEDAAAPEGTSEVIPLGKPSLGSFVIAQIRQLDTVLAGLAADKESLPERAEKIKAEISEEIAALEARTVHLRNKLANFDQDIAGEHARLTALEEGADMAKDAFGLALNNLPPEIIPVSGVLSLDEIPADILPSNGLDRPIALPR